MAQFNDSIVESYTENICDMCMIGQIHVHLLQMSSSSCCMYSACVRACVLLHEQADLSATNVQYYYLW